MVHGIFLRDSAVDFESSFDESDAYLRLRLNSLAFAHFVLFYSGQALRDRFRSRYEIPQFVDRRLHNSFRFKMQCGFRKGGPFAAILL